jgi:hypothetical protein
VGFSAFFTRFFSTASRTYANNIHRNLPQSRRFVTVKSVFIGRYTALLKIDLQTAQRELTIDLQTVQSKLTIDLQAAQAGTELRLQTAQRELTINLQAAQRELKIDLQAAHAALKKDLNEVIQLSGYKLLFSMSTIFAGLLSVFVAVGGDLVVRG